MTTSSKSAERRARKAAEMQLFVQRCGRKTRSGGLDPNDRAYDRRLEDAAKRMKPEQLDGLPRDGEDEWSLHKMPADRDSMTDWIEHFRTAARGMKVSHIWRGQGSALFLELGKLTPTSRRDGSPGVPQGEIGLMIEWSWRIENEGSIVCGTESDEDLWGQAFDRLVGCEVVGLSTFGRLPEVMLSLSGDLHVASFMTAEGDPEWALFDRRGPKVITLGCQSGVITARHGH